MKVCNTGTGLDKQNCLATGFIGRMSFCLSILHLLTFFISLARNEMAAQWHDGFWGLKAVAVAGGWIASFWISADFFTGFFLTSATWISAIFLLFQALLMLEVAYKINNTVVGNYNKK